MTARTSPIPSLALLLGLAGVLGSGLAALPALAADDASTPPSLPKHEMGGNDSKPGFFDTGSGNAPAGQKEQKVPGPGKAAGASYPDAPPVPSAR